MSTAPTSPPACVEDVGKNHDQELPFTFTGKIEKVTVELKPERAARVAEAAE